MKFLYLALALVAGAGVAVQSVVNSKLKTFVGSPMQATLISLLVSLAAAGSICLIARYQWPDRSTLASMPWPAWCGGLLGVFFLSAMVVATPRLGLGVTLALVVAGQMTTSLWLDHTGWLDMPSIPVTPYRLLGAALVVVGAAVLAATR